jgi:hypothetical protein
MLGSNLVHFTEYSNIFPKIVVTALTANINSKLNLDTLKDVKVDKQSQTLRNYVCL